MPEEIVEGGSPPGGGGGGLPSDPIQRAVVRLNEVYQRLQNNRIAQQAASNKLANIRNQLTVLKTLIQSNATTVISSMEDLKLLLAQLNTDVLKVGTEVAGILADSNKTNHVVVYAMTYDANGYYAAPSSALLTALDTYLEARRLVNVTVECVSGMTMVKKCGIDVDVKIGSGYVSSTVIGNVRTALALLLKGKDFGESLYLSDVYDTIMGVDGVRYAIATITSDGDTEYLIDGNFDLSGTSYVLSKDDGAIDTVIVITEI